MTDIQKERGIPIEYPPNPNDPKEYVVQDHWEQKSVHIDLRIRRDADHLEGWTLLAQEADVVDEPVETLQEAREWANKQKLWKIDVETGKVPDTRVETTINGERRTVVRPGSLAVEQKAQLIPEDWLDVEGEVPGREGEIFHVRDRGKIVYGARKSRFFEYFVEEGDFLHERIIFRYLAREQGDISKDVWEQIKDGNLTLVYVNKNEDEGQAERQSGYWVMMTPDPIPYVLSKDAQDEGWVPPQGASALPRKIREKIPEKYRYWTKEGEAERKELRDELLKDEPDFLSKSVSDQGKFKLLKQTWEEPAYTRWGQSDTAYYLMITSSKKRLFSLENDPREKKTISAVEETINVSKKQDVLNKIRIQEKVEPKTMLNPTKNKPSLISLEDSGDVSIEKRDEGLQVRFDGKDLSGCYVLVQEDETETWTFEVSEDQEKQSMVIKGTDEEKRIAYGVVLQPGVIDFQGDVVSEEEISDAIWHFMKEGQKHGLLHKGLPRRDINVVECYQAPITFRHVEDNPDTEVLKGSWVLAVKCPTDVWNDVKAGKLTGFSIQGLGKRHKLNLPQ